MASKPLAETPTSVKPAGPASEMFATVVALLPVLTLTAPGFCVSQPALLTSLLMIWMPLLV